MSLALHPIVTVIIALSPAVFSYWRGRILLANRDDAALPERSLAANRRTGSVFGVAIGLLLATAPGRLVWALPLLIVARMLAAYPLRKQLHNETWSVWAYVSFYVRLMVAAFGLWLLVAAAPAVASLAGTRDWMLAIALGTIAVAWHAHYVRIFRMLLRTKAVSAPAIRSRFEQLANDCGLPAIALEQTNLRGGSFTNAVALASTGASAVVVTDTLLSRLEEDEVTAILAHELAHLEHFTRRRLVRASIATCSIISAGGLLPSLVRVAAFPGGILLLWPLTIAVGLVLHLQQRQKHETESDLRAVALTRDPEALVRALTKLHESARIPRRWDAEFERQATHPSLARRIQAIRRVSGVEPASLAKPETFAASDGVSVTFHRDRLEWRDEMSMTHAIPYQSLRELRIDASSPSTQLLAVDSSARRWTIPVHAADIARVQSVLDVIDVHLGKADAPAFMPISAPKLAALVVMVASVAAGQLSVLFTGILVLIQPASQIAAAAGISALAASLFAWRDRTSWASSEFSAWLPVTLGIGGIALVAMAFARRRDAPRGVSTSKVVWVLAASAAFGWAIAALFGTSALDFHRNLRELPSVAVLTFAAASTLLFARSPRARWGCLPLTLVGMSAAFMASTTFVDRFVIDPFVAPTPVVTIFTQTTEPVREFSIDFFPSSLLLSPETQHVAFTTEDADERSIIRAGRAGGSLAAFAADEAVFVAERELLLLERNSRESVLRLVELAESSREVWTLRVPVRWADLSIDRPSRRWRLLGHDADGDIVAAEGEIGKPAIQQSQWKVPEAADGLQPLAVSGVHLLAIETHYADTTMPIVRLLSIPTLSSLGRGKSSLWSLTDRSAAVFGTSHADLSCHASPMIGDPPICAAFDGTTTRFFTLAAPKDALTPLASVLGRVYITDMDDRGWLTGWWDSTAVALRPSAREAVQFSRHAGTRGPYHVVVGNSGVAGIFMEGEMSIIRIHPAMRTNMRVTRVD